MCTTSSHLKIKMIVRVYTYSLPLVLQLFFKSEITTPIIVTGYDDKHANTIFFSQRITPEWLKGVDGKLEFNLPLSPDDYMMVKITDEERDVTVADLLQIKTVPLKTKALYLTPFEEEFVRCAEWFSAQAGFLQPEYYQRDKVQFQYFPSIVDNGQELNTPARVDHETGIVQVSKIHFDQYTIPMRMFVLTHEMVHYVKETKNEQEADLNAMNICLARGFPKMELLYAATKIFPDNPETRQRLDAMVNFASNYN